jgi:hypothetical protein
MKLRNSEGVAAASVLNLLRNAEILAEIARREAPRIEKTGLTPNC